jgi:hypothetical protein
VLKRNIVFQQSLEMGFIYINMKKFEYILGRIFRFTLTELFIWGPPSVCFFVLYRFSINEFQSAPAEEFYKLVAGSIAITATLSSLTLNLSSRISKDKQRSEVFRKIGERFLHAVLLLVMALIVKFAEVQVVDKITTAWVTIIIKIYFKVLLSFFVFYGAGYFVFALMLAHKKLFEGNEKPYDEIK